jgi:Type VI secretion system (T6SS), amidase effector protein 4
MAQLLSYSALWDSYPDYGNYPTPEAVKKLIGGAVDDTWITNTCAIRMSRALNENNVPVPGNFAGLHTVRGGDGKRYAFRVRELHAWLDHALGSPNFDVKKKEGDAFDKSGLASLKGIIGFDIHFADATGHFDLWDGKQFSDEYQSSHSYWSAATRIWLWKAS